MRYRAKLLAFVFVCAFTSVKAMGTGWKAVPPDNKSQQIAVSAKNDDGGKLVVLCDTATKTISIRLEEPRADWRIGAHMRWITKADAGAEFVPSAGIVTAPTRIIVTGESRRDIATMKQAKTFFIVDVGDFSRIFTADNFKKAVDLVLHACSDH